MHIPETTAELPATEVQPGTESWQNRLTAMYERAGLRQSLKMLNEEVELASGNLSLINNSTAKLAHTSDEYTRQESRLSKSRGLLKLIKFLDRREDLLLYAGIAIFSAAVLYVVLRRTMHFVPAVPSIPWESFWPQQPSVLQEQPVLHIDHSPEL